MAKTIVESLHDDPSKVNKLPVWAQDLVWKLTREIQEKDKLLAARDKELAADPDGSNTFVVTYGISGQPDRPLGKSPLLGFRLRDDARSYEFRVQLVSDGGLVVDAIGGGLSIEPNVSNSVTVRHKRL